ncbi:cation:proton antiporter [Corynebacterium sp. HMSC066C02]|uniref:monovalent cation/H(+) antiporter subunit G n=1 Tax=Corynebacterium sp. HMSC066C02 TaxID=1739500 RepID=UPI0008A21FE5|nr:monovalent cation/H(+) antiporter subunit G [Corynebacterium sp. HMSC066C02]OFP21522.1 cation:proton antiporter [Corynebacterium sp. HMSC066C02]
MSYALIADVLSIILILVGSILILAAAIGVARFGDTMARVHAIAKPQTTGLIFTILGAIIKVTGSESFSVAERGDLGILVLLVLFAMITSPVTAQRTTRIARREGLYGTPDSMLHNEAPAARSLRRK